MKFIKVVPAGGRDLKINIIEILKALQGIYIYIYSLKKCNILWKQKVEEHKGNDEVSE
jgi:hypothetical protein